MAHLVKCGPFGQLWLTELLTIPPQGDVSPQPIKGRQKSRPLFISGHCDLPELPSADSLSAYV